jgi:hypothetical protein
MSTSLVRQLVAAHSSDDAVGTAGGVARLAALRSAGLVHRASERVHEGVEQTLPVVEALRPLLPGGSLRRGGTVALRGPWAGEGPTSLLLALLAQASSEGSWCAVVGQPHLGLVAAAEAGVAVQRLALVPQPGADWAEVTGALLDGLDIVVVAVPGGAAPQLASRLAAKARQRGAVLVGLGAWPGADVVLEVVRSTWQGLDRGIGRLRQREVEVVASGRGAAARTRRLQLWLPGPDGLPATAAPTLARLSTVDGHGHRERRAS